MSRSCRDLGQVLRSGLLALVFRLGLLALDWCAPSCCLGCFGGFLQVSGRRLFLNRPSLYLACQDLLVRFGHPVGVLLLCLGLPLLCLTHRRGR